MPTTTRAATTPPPTGAVPPGAAPATTLPGPAVLTPPVPASSVVVAGITGPVPVPGIPAVDERYTEGQAPAVLLQRAIDLSTVGASQAPLEAQLTGAEQALDAQSVTAAHASAAATRAVAAAAAAGHRAATATREAATLQSALRSAALQLYTGQSSRSSPPSVADVDQLGAAAVYEDTILSPDGILAAERGVAKAARTDLSQRRKDEATATKEAADAQAALASAAAAAAQLHSLLSVLSTTTARLIADEHTALSGQAAQALTTPGALEFTPAAPLPAPLPTTSVALAWAFSELGTPYLWGGTGPAMFDCSGLTQYVWGKAGVTTPRVAQDQETWAVPVPLSQLLPGDLVFYGTGSDIHHVGIYIGGGLMLNAPHTGTVVQVSPIWWTDLFGFGRVHADGIAVPARPGSSGAVTATPTVVPTAGAVPSEITPPPGYVAPPGATAPVVTTTVPSPGSTTTTATTVAPGATTTTVPTSTTTVATSSSTTEPARSTTTTSLPPAPARRG